MPRRKKEDIAAEICAMLGVTLTTLTKMSLEDLLKLHESIKAMVESKRAGLLPKIMNKKVTDLTIGEMLQGLKEAIGDEGILGLGILPKAVKAIKSATSE
ncbi:hypothetical protein DRN86_01355 [Candidatus Geothermarchaeota archaeon]|nr:MAG: hypothetical protein DRN86_01355 [Candidatus Geothermarchaeota archaeon]